MKINESILLWKWPRNIFDVEDDAYETPILAYNRKLDVFILASSITGSDVEEESSPPYLENVVTILEEEMTNLQDTTPWQLHHGLQRVPLNWTTHQWNLAQLNMLGKEFGDAFEIDNNYKA
jgi:hypothetical protein